MRHPISEELISAYLDGQLPDDQRVQVEQAMREDAELQRMYDQFRQLRAALQGLPRGQPPKGLSTRALQLAERRMLASQDSRGEHRPPDEAEGPVRKSSSAAATWWRNRRVIAGLLSAAAVLGIALWYWPHAALRGVAIAPSREAVDSTRGLSRRSAVESGDADSAVAEGEKRSADLEAESFGAAPRTAPARAEKWRKRDSAKEDAPPSPPPAAPAAPDPKATSQPSPKAALGLNAGRRAGEEVLAEPGVAERAADARSSGQRPRRTRSQAGSYGMPGEVDEAAEPSSGSSHPAIRPEDAARGRGKKESPADRQLYYEKNGLAKEPIGRGGLPPLPRGAAAGKAAGLGGMAGSGGGASGAPASAGRRPPSLGESDSDDFTQIRVVLDHEPADDQVAEQLARHRLLIVHAALDESQVSPEFRTLSDGKSSGAGPSAVTWARHWLQSQDRLQLLAADKAPVAAWADAARFSQPAARAGAALAAGTPVITVEGSAADIQRAVRRLQQRPDVQVGLVDLAQTADTLHRAAKVDQDDSGEHRLLRERDTKPSKITELQQQQRVTAEDAQEKTPVAGQPSAKGALRKALQRSWFLLDSTGPDERVNGAAWIIFRVRPDTADEK